MSLEVVAARPDRSGNVHTCSDPRISLGCDGDDTWRVRRRSLARHGMLVVSLEPLGDPAGEGQSNRPDRSIDEVEVLAKRMTIVTALPLKPAARDRLARLLDARVLDVRDAVDHADVVLAPAGSPQLIGTLRRTYGDARIIVVELDDEDLDIELSGPVKRILRGGADGYVLADSLDELATKIGPRPDPSEPAPDAVEARELAASAGVDDLIEVLLREAMARSEQRIADENSD